MELQTTEKKFNPILKEELKKIFKDKNFRKMSNFERRKCVFDYLVQNSEYDFSLLNDIYTGKIRNYLDEIYSVLKPTEENKKLGVCNSFSYVYKYILDKLRIPCMLVTCNVEEESLEDLNNMGVNTAKLKKNSEGIYKIPHMMVLVENDDQTFSFDDITYAIFNRGTDKEKDYFNYDNNQAKINKQADIRGFETFMLRFMVEDSQDTKDDLLYREIFKDDDCFLRVPVEYIRTYNDSKNQVLDKCLEER